MSNDTDTTRETDSCRDHQITFDATLYDECPICQEKREIEQRMAAGIDGEYNSNDGDTTRESDRESGEDRTFRVVHDDDRTILIPQFWPSDLTDDERRVYYWFRREWDTDDGALVAPPVVARELADRETITIREVVRLFAQETVAALREIWRSMIESFTPVFADAVETVAELQSAMDSDGSDD